MSTKSIIDFPDEFVVVDIETTGLSKEFDEIIEVSALHVKNWELIDSFSELTQPYSYFDCDDPDDPDAILVDKEKNIYGYYVYGFITYLTGITNKMLENARKIDVVLKDFLDYIGDLPIVGHNVSFDYNFIMYNAEKFDLIFKNNQRIDTMRMSKKLFKENKGFKLKNICGYLKVPYDDTKAHRGIYDCRYTTACYYRIYQIIMELYGSKEAFAKEFNHYYNRKHKYVTVEDLKNIKPESDDIDETNPLFGMEIVFTGKLEKMERKIAQQIAVNFGATLGKSVTKKTNILVLGDNDYCPLIKDGKSAKQKKAEELILNGQDIQIMPETVFYEIVLKH